MLYVILGIICFIVTILKVFLAHKFIYYSEIGSPRLLLCIAIGFIFLVVGALSTCRVV